MNAENRSKLALITATVIFGSIGIFRKYIPLPSGTLAMLRGIIGVIFLLAFVYMKGDKLSSSKVKENFKVLILSGALIGFNWILLFEAYRFTTVSTATLCYYMAPVFVILASPLLLKEKLTIKKLCCTAVAIGGMVLVSGVANSEFSGIGEFKGVLCALGAAVFYACVVILNKKCGEISAYDKTIVQLAAASAVIVPYVIAAEVETLAGLEISAVTVVMVLIVGILNTGIAYAIYFGSMDNLKAQTIALFSYIDPIVAIILSALLLKENMGLYGVIGAVLVLGSTFISEMPEKERN